jgi:hypothetical protein
MHGKQSAENHFTSLQLDLNFAHCAWLVVPCHPALLLLLQLVCGRALRRSGRPAALGPLRMMRTH